MIKKSPISIMFLLSTFLFLSACSNSDTSNTETKAEKKEEAKFEKLAEEKNKELELELEPLELTSYSEEVGASIKEPAYKEFAVNGKVVVEGEVEKYSALKSEYAWIKVRASEEGHAGYDHEYYTPIKEGKFKQPIRFFNGEGEYRVTVQLPSMDSENYYYDTAAFTVHNINPEADRDVTFTPFGQEAEMALNLKSSYVKENEIFSLSGKAVNLTDSDTIMLKINKDAEMWKHVIPIEEGKFSYDVPLFYGKGLHKLEILVPDKERENYYQTATTLLIDNESDRTMSPIEYSKTYEERGVTLEYPQYGGEESDGTFSVKGKIDPKAEFGPETTHIYITTKKGEDEALDVIPVEDFTFDDSFYLRFGPGTYEVTLSVPEIKEENSDYFRFYGFAKFEVESTGGDKRDLLPSRGVQSDAEPITELARKLTEGKSSDREKAKAIYDYVAKTISYDVKKLETDDFNWDDSALKTLDSKTGVCQDYSYLAIALLRASNMEARFVEGTAFSGFWPQKHAWVEVKVDGRWLTMDPTWGAGYIKDDKFVAAFNEKYFDPNKEEFEKTHYRTGVSY
ncbi:transglutaminase domain-containing protein [Bacillus sp. ISL-47]|uniref:transglutaminase domain-containing protein n=1 Tax=Bacillus sp. ISL-47 TaxID=2819130 RepID=UPI001BE5DF7F|nr:transglutaminase domain-containing protein [Bacillus sp. ISL-47]MBT2691250.1 transglutaminase domain-containing protein [Bacillus sp. ISL-47]MBT2708928.1 transglutaminase domain-containing protein [Pseudomonas sp. ISL-84]